MLLLMCTSLLCSVVSEKNRWLTTQQFDQYALIVFRRMLDSVAVAPSSQAQVPVNLFGSIQQQSPPEGDQSILIETLSCQLLALYSTKTILKEIFT